MPDNINPGTLEDFLETLIPEKNPLWEFAEEKTQEAKKDYNAPFPDKDFKKAKIHCWLAWQEKPGKPYGTAINAKFLNHDSTIANDFVSWFKKLFLEDIE